MASKPLAGETGDLVERVGVVEPAPRVRDERQGRRAAKPPPSLTVQFEGELIVAADDQQRRTADLGKHAVSEIRSPVGADHGRDLGPEFRGGANAAAAPAPVPR